MTARDELIEVIAEGIAFAEQFHAEEYHVWHGAAAAVAWIEERFGKVMIQRYDPVTQEYTYDEPTNSSHVARVFSAGNLVPPPTPQSGRTE